jgi:hypothetical protein
MKIQVLAEREQKIQTEVKEIRKVFYCELCNKQYKLAMEFEAHLSSYDHNHRKVDNLSNTNLALLLTRFQITSVFPVLPNAKYLMLNMQRFKEMKEMHGSSSRDDRQKREQQRQEKELAKFAQMYAFSVSIFTFILKKIHLLLFPSFPFYFGHGWVLHGQGRE